MAASKQAGGAMRQSSKEVRVRPMVETDLARVNEIDRMLFGVDRVPTWPFSFEAYWAVYRPKLSLVAEVADRVVGFVVGNIVPEEQSQSVLSLRHSPDRPTHHRRVGWIDMIGIDPESQGGGIGRKLVDAFYAECKQSDAAVKGMARDNDERLRKFLASVGFKPSGLVVYEKD
jgi:ribosomal protein S18 acetylase RimI-like enzyme